MFCWLVVCNVQHPHLDAGDELCVLRRVFGETPEHAFEIVACLLALHGWTGEVRVCDIVSAAQPHSAPLLDVRCDFVPPVAQLDRTAGARTRQDARTTPDTSAPRIDAPRAPQTPSGRPATPAVRARRTRRPYRKLGCEDARPSDCELAAFCGWGVDRRSASFLLQLEPPHHDPLHVNSRWPDALAFGPDALATEELPEEDCPQRRGSSC